MATTTTKGETTMTVGQTIAQQIGNKAFTMMGAKNLVQTEKSLQWQIGRNSKGITHVIVALAPTDTYTVQFIKINRKYTVTKVVTVDDVYVDSLHTTIENNIGLYLSL